MGEEETGTELRDRDLGNDRRAEREHFVAL